MTPWLLTRFPLSYLERRGSYEAAPSLGDMELPSILTVQKHPGEGGKLRPVT